MDISRRAKQFMPFSALTGLERALREKERQIVDKPALSDDFSDEINSVLTDLQAGDRVEIDYYSEGEILSVTGLIEKIGSSELVVNGVKIKVDDIIKANNCLQI